MDRSTAIRLLSLYLPVVVAVLIAQLRPKPPRLFPAALVGFAWSLPSLLALQLMNVRYGWWLFHAEGGMFRGMPVDLLLGWAVLWGLIPILAFPRLPWPWVVGFFVAADLLLMPASRPVVELGDLWLAGELVALCCVLIPSLLFARWTLHDTNLKARAFLHVMTFGSVFFFLIPEIIFAMRPESGWQPLLGSHPILRNLELQAVALLALPGLSAVQEFAGRGFGTPIPYDPPKRLVGSGLYRYIANPMQFSCALVMIAWGAVLHNRWVAAAGIMAFLYGWGLANWDEGEDLKARFGGRWVRYRENVRPWRLRWRPWQDPHSPLPRLYIAETCGPCSEIRLWFEARKPVSLEILPAEEHPTRALRRITYDPMDGSEPEEGVRAFARGLEHINLVWAYAGALLRLPGISTVIQIILDASGFGPRTIPSCPRDGREPFKE